MPETINPELLRLAADNVTKPRRRKQAAAQENEPALAKEALVPGGGDPGAAPPGGAPMSGADPNAAAAGAAPPGAAPPGGVPADPSQAGAAPPTGLAGGVDPMSMITQAVAQGIAQAGGGAGGKGAGGKGKQDLIPEIHASMYRLNAVMTAIANAMGIQIPAEAVQGPPPEQPATTPQPNPQPQPAPQAQGQQPGIPPMQPMDGQLPKAAAFLLDDEEPAAASSRAIDLDKYGSLLELLDDEDDAPALPLDQKQAAAPVVGSVYQALGVPALRHSPTLLAARLRERNRTAS